MMLLGADATARVRRQILNHPAAKIFADAVLQQATDVHLAPPLGLEFEPGRDVILPTSRTLLHRVLTLGMAAIIDGSNRHRLRAISDMKRAAAFDSWNPRHFLDTAEMMTAMGLGLDWFAPLMTPAERAVIEVAIVDKGLRPGLDALNEQAFWTNATHNWNIVCCSGLTIAALALRPRHPALCSEILQRAGDAMRAGLSAFEPDGGYEEGPGYWDYAVRYAALAQAARIQAGLTGDAPQALVSSWRYGKAVIGPSGRVFNYGDTADDLGRSPVLGWLARESGDPEAAGWQHATPGEAGALDLLWFAPPNADDAAGGSVTSFQKAGLSVLRTGGSDEIYLALKGGRNGVNHAHLDLGTFVLDIGPARIACELGREDYALPGYFDPSTRFGYFRTSTAAHNTLLINGCNQSMHASASLIGTRCDPGVLAAAYRIDDSASPLSRIRGAIIANEESILVVDELARRQAEDADVIIEWRMFTQGRVTCDGGVAFLVVDGVDVTLEIQDPAGARWMAEPAPSFTGMADNSAFTCLRFSALATLETSRIAVAIRRTGAGPKLFADPGPIAGWQLQLTPAPAEH
ncbi:heparinase II/III domain-containing protein [Pararhizobium sp.]|uniref:heparinase II/III domain-containing protein n=1 Tax=Pararhizobium sp. TaxID=1977563 RepID=UPI002718773B|nr:heparinase II/III family protein [Pararhizobium sp.]MDO9416195.1 heparinase II/III family protein [Pararhizobium sp.]